MYKISGTVLLTLLTSTASSQPFEITRYTIAGGASTSSAGTYSLSGTIGQHDAGEPMTGGVFSVAGGFWPGADPSGGRLCADQNGDGLVSPTDFTAWIANYNANDQRADTNQDGSITPTDFTAWIAAFNLGLAGPYCTP